MRFFRDYTLELPDKKTPIRLLVGALFLIYSDLSSLTSIVECLADGNDEVADEASSGLRKLARQAIKELRRDTALKFSVGELDDESSEEDAERDCLIPLGFENLFSDASWSLIVHSALSLLTRLVARGFHKNPPTKEQVDQYLAKAQPSSCKYL